MNIKSLSLYHYQSCPYCEITRQSIQQNGVEVELRDIQLSPVYLNELITYGGIPQVPCLLIEKEDGDSEWLYESDDIIRFVSQYSAQQKRVA